MEMSSNIMLYIILGIATLYILFKSTSMIFKIGFILCVTGYLYYQYTQGLL